MSICLGIGKGTGASTGIGASGREWGRDQMKFRGREREWKRVSERAKWCTHVTVNIIGRTALRMAAFFSVNTNRTALRRPGRKLSTTHKDPLSRKAAVEIKLHSQKAR